MASLIERLRRRKKSAETEFEEARQSKSASDIDISKVKVNKIGLKMSDGSTSSRLNYEEPVGFTFDEITNAYLTDSYIRQSVDKHVDFAFKAGWDLVGSNADAVEYVNSRFRAMELAMGKPIDVFLKETYKQLKLYGNAFIQKNWAKNNYVYPGGLVVNPGMYRRTIVGYEILPVDSITIARDAYGNVVKYQQEVDGSTEDAIELAPENIVHMYMDRPAGRGFGLPYLLEAMEDVKLLRQLEGLTMKAVYKNIFPLHVYTVGLKEEGMRCKEGEIDQVKEDLGDLTMDGGIVIPERHKIEILGSEGKVLNVEDYLSYFENRAFTALSVSPTIMGRSDTSNKSTASNLDQMFKDKVKSDQKCFSDFVSFNIVLELLAEGGFNFIQDPSLRVGFRFREIDMDAQIATENHSIQMLMQNGITYPEFRKRIGYDPLTNYDELYFNVVKNNAGEAEANAKEKAASNSGSNKNNPENQHGKTNAKTKKESIDEALKLLQCSLLKDDLTEEEFNASTQLFKSRLSNNIGENNMVNKILTYNDNDSIFGRKAKIEMLRYGLYHDIEH